LESSTYHILKGMDLEESPTLPVMNATEEFQHSTRFVDKLWQTDFTYFKIQRRGWDYLSTVLDDFHRCIQVWKVITTMSASDMQKTLLLVLR
jgi:transposase InsO family protein